MEKFKKRALLRAEQQLIDRSKSQCFALIYGDDIIGVGFAYNSNDPGDPKDGIEVIGISWATGGSCNLTMEQVKSRYTLKRIDLNSLNI